MRKLISLLAICTTFTLAMYMGYNAASLSMTQAQPEETLAPTSSPSATQQNILLIQYDENTGSQPALQAVWLVAFFKSTNQTVISFSPLYPSVNPSRLSDLNTIFSLRPDSSPSKQFLNAISAARIDWSGYLLIDQAGSLQIEEWMKEQGVPIFSQASLAPLVLIETACDYLRGKASSAGSSISKFDWNQFDAHFQTNVPFDTLLAGWNDLFDDTRPIRCEVVKD